MRDAQQINLLDCVRGAKTVEEVHEGNARFVRRRPRNEREVVRFLDAGGTQHRPAGRTRRHHVAVVAKDGQGLRRDVNTVGVSSPAILNMFGIIRNSPCEAVNVVASAPVCSVP